MTAYIILSCKRQIPTLTFECNLKHFNILTTIYLDQIFDKKLEISFIMGKYIQTVAHDLYM